MDDLLLWQLARASGLTAYVGLCIAVLTGLAPRTQLLGFLASNRAVRALHDFTPWVVIPASLTHVIGLVLDETARVGIVDLFVPFQMSYGQLAIGLGTISLDLLLVVLVTTWLRRHMSNRAWQHFHRLGYLGFIAMFVHALFSGTDLTSPVISAVTWAAALLVGYHALERAGKALVPARVRT